MNEGDRRLVRQLRDFVPREIYDIHVHPHNPALYGVTAWPGLRDRGVAGCEAHRKAVRNQTGATTVHGLYFGAPHASGDRSSVNRWVAEEVRTRGRALDRKLLLAAPGDDQEVIAENLRSGQFQGIKVYHIFASRPDTMNATITEYASEWMWKLLDAVGGVLLLHIVRPGGIADEENQRQLRVLCETYPRCKVVLAHIARSFNYRHARRGLASLKTLDNVVVDTSAVTESEAIRAAIETLGPGRVLFGSDFFVSEMRGRCVGVGDDFFWLLQEVLDASLPTAHTVGMTLVGIESLLCLKEAAEDCGLLTGDIEDLFLNNALRLLNITPAAEAVPGANLWRKAREVISCGTGLMSKRAELFDAQTWPSYFSKCSGCDVWDLEGRRLTDFAGGIGAVLLGYADPEVTSAVRRRLNQGTYCSLVTPQEVELAERLLGLHPWASKVRYARGGGEAMTMAVRIARAATGKSGVAFCGYHGWHDWYLAANLGENSALDGHLLPGLEPLGVPRELAGTSVAFRYNNFASFEEALGKLGGNLAAVVMEPMRSQFPMDGFVQKVAERCRANGGVFLVDEITSGLRFGHPGALSRIGVDPDLVVYAKAFGNGFPFATVIGREEIMAAADASFISSSYWTDGVGPAAALAVLEKSGREDVHQQVWEMGGHLQRMLRDLAAEFPLCRLVVGGMPASPTMTFNLGGEAPCAQAMLVRKMIRRGFLVSSVYYVMLAHTADRVDRVIAALREALAEIEMLIDRDELAAESGVKTATTGFARLT